MVNEAHWCQKANDTLDKSISFLCGILIVAFIYSAYWMMEVIINAPGNKTFIQLVVGFSGIFCCGMLAGVYTLIMAQDIKKRIKEK